jgi:TetR/AcrR family transcriptional repressor of nem operon
LERQWETLEREVLQPAFAKDVPPLERIRRMFRMSYEFQCVRKNETGHMIGCPFGLFAAEMSTQDEAIRQRLQRAFSDIAAYFADTLHEIAETEKIPLNASSAGQGLLAYMQGAMLLAKTNDDPAMFSRLAELAVPLPVLS